jgi:hypothetical protein
MRSTSAAIGIVVSSSAPGCSSRSWAITSRCRRLRRSAIEKNAITRGPSSCVSSSSICSNVRLERVAGMIGTSRTSAASNTLSLTRDTLGGQSRNV